MSYVDNNLLSGEKVMKRASVHWFVYLGPALYFAFFLVFPHWLNPFLYMSGIALVWALVAHKCTELAITDRRVIGKIGFIRRTTVDMNLDKVEGLLVDQGIVGRILNFGSLAVTGTGGGSVPFAYITDPLGFRRSLNEILEKRSEAQRAA